MDDTNTLPTTRNIIKLLPFEEKYKLELLERYDKANSDEKFDLDGMLWDAYSKWYELTLDKNYKVALANVMDRKEHLDNGLAKRLQEKTNEDLQKDQTKTAEKVDLTAARAAMEKIVAEIHASKKQKAS